MSLSWFSVSVLLVCYLINLSRAACPNNCQTYFDGCNQCTCNPEDGSTTCTKMACSEYKEPYCMDCENNLEWHECGSGCTPTCDDPNPVCTDVCVSRCECPKDKPIYKNGTCVDYSGCSFENRLNPLTNRQRLISDTLKCPFGCRSYYDGCNYCSCNDDGTIGACTLRYCFVHEEPRCIQCESTMTWNNCSNNCIRTCNTSEVCAAADINYCVPRCECPSDAPIYYNGECIQEEYCNLREACPANCLIYTDGCNECICNQNGTDACTDRQCVWEGIPECTKCASNMVWTECASACTPTCQDPDPPCHLACVARCACPANKPILKDGVCVPRSSCQCNCKSKINFLQPTRYCSSKKGKGGCQNSRFCKWGC